jgi:hypothetical protein
MKTTELDTVTATMIAESQIEPAYPEQFIEAWQYLIDNGMVWKLQGFFGRTAKTLISEGLCTMPNDKS